jgi:hypothetical protein
MTKRNRRKRTAQPAPADDIQSWGFQGMTQVLGVAPEIAYGQIVQNLVDDPDSLALVTAIFEGEQGREMREQSAAEWAALGFPPPWVRAQEILAERGQSDDKS